MLIDNIIQKLDDGNQKTFHSFETFVLNLLAHHAQESGKQFTEISGKNVFGDGLALEGIDDLEGKVLFEVKAKLHRRPLSTLRAIGLQPAYYKAYKDIDHLVLITDIGESDKHSQRLEKYISDEGLSYDIHIWGLSELNKFVSKYRKKANEIVDNLFSLRIESSLVKSNKDWKIELKDRVEVFKELYRKGQFTFFLGAGVSSSAGMPDWNTLLNSLFVEYLTKELDQKTSVSDQDLLDIVERLNSIDEPSSLMAARYLRKGLSKSGNENLLFIKAITNSLYKLRDSSRSLGSELIQAICALCIPKRTGAKIKSVITYNFDDLIERQLQQNNIDYHSIYSETDSYELDELPIYHVHGFLPHDRENYEGLENGTLVFSEEGYHHIYNDSYHWSNMVQLNSLRESNCLMVGLSMTDPNLRRLLEIAARNFDKPRHFAFMKRIKKENFIYEVDASSGEKIKIIDNELGAEDFLEKHHVLNEELMKELGVTILWYEEYNEIPEILNDIRGK